MIDININQRIHLIGVGGIGMSALARVLLSKHFQVQGSDVKESGQTIRLKDEGVQIFIGHNAHNIRGADVVVISAAIRPDNPELEQAVANNLPVIMRAEMLGFLMSSHSVRIAVSGTHGKTTTSAMIAWVLLQMDRQPTYMIGGNLCDLQINAAGGAKEYVVAEADESDGSFLKLCPNCAVVTNIELEHCDYYHSMQMMIDIYVQFIKLVPLDGHVVVCGDHPNVKILMHQFDRKYITYGFEPDNSYRAEHIRVVDSRTLYDVYQGAEKLGVIELCIAGRHNVLNSLAAIAVLTQYQLPFDGIANALQSFHGTKRRFEELGNIRDILVYDDYAHHPTEVAATLEAARSIHKRRIIAVFQPHRFSRTQALHEEFGRCFALADEVIVTSVYSAGEEPIDGANGELIANKILEYDPKPVKFYSRKDEIPPYLITILKPGDLLITLGAGDIQSVGLETVRRLSKGS